ncbi:MAG: ABC transporter substrate-binding protein [Caldimonas sp.]
MTSRVPAEDSEVAAAWWRRVARVLAVAFGVFGSAAGATPNTFAIPDLPAFSTTLIAEAQGYIAAELPDLKIIHCVNGKRCLKHLLDGEAQFAAAADTPIVLASLAGARFELLATLSTTSRENHFIGRADRDIRSAADLKGKRIGVVKGTSGHYFADSMLLFHGIRLSEVTLVGLDAADAVSPLVRGDVDAAGLYQPHGYQASRRLGANAVNIPNPRIFTMNVNLVGVTGTNRPRDEDAVKLLRALRRANAFIAAEPASARAIVAARLRLDPAELDDIWGDFDFEMSLNQPLVTTLEAQARWALREKVVPEASMPDYLDYITVEPLRALDRKLVNIVK